MLELGEQVPEAILGVGRSPDRGGEPEVASAKVQGIAGRNLDLGGAAAELAFSRAGAMH